MRDVSFEPVTVDWTIQHHRRDHPGLAMAVRVFHPQALASGATAMAVGHVGGSLGLVDEDQAKARRETEIQPRSVGGESRRKLMALVTVW